MTATLSEDIYLPDVFEALESNQIQALVASGLLADLQRCAAECNPIKVDRKEYQEILGLEPTVFRVKMGGPETTDQITASLGFPFDEWINQRNLPLMSREVVDEEIEIINPNCGFNEEEGLKLLAEAGLDRPTYEHAIRFAEQHGKSTTSERRPLVIFLHESWRIGRRVVCLRRYPGFKRLDLHNPGRRFYVRCALAGIRPRKPARATAFVQSGGLL